jgi:hypothetical protein
MTARPPRQSLSTCPPPGPDMEGRREGQMPRQKPTASEGGGDGRAGGPVRRGRPRPLEVRLRVARAVVDEGLARVAE